jgi:hypothetical protein
MHILLDHVNHEAFLLIVDYQPHEEVKDKGVAKE